MRKLVIIIILLISNFSFYGVVSDDGEKVTDIQEIMQNENVVANQIVENETKLQEEKETETDEKALVVEEIQAVKVEERTTETVTENKESTVKEKQVEDVEKAKKEKTTEVSEEQVEKNVEEKIEENQVKETEENQNISNHQENVSNTPKCTDNNHGMDTGNCKTWFETKEQAIAFYNAKKKEWEDKWTNYEINNEEYFNNRPNGYEIWDCPYCHKWTINIY